MSLKVTPPLIINRKEIDIAVAILDQAMADVERWENVKNMDKVRQYAGW